MSYFDSYETHFGDLEPGARYQVTYRVTCLNSVSPAEVQDILARSGILMTPTAGLINGLAGHADEFMVTDSMSQTTFKAVFANAFDQADKTAWFSCSTPTVVSLERFVKGSGLPTASGFTLGVIASVLLIAGAIYLGGRR